MKPSLSCVIMDIDHMNRSVLLSMGVLLLSLLAGCQSQWAPSAGFGDSVNQAVSAQFANPDAPMNNPAPKSGMDGAAAKAGMDNYVLPSLGFRDGCHTDLLRNATKINGCHQGAVCFVNFDNFSGNS